MISVQIITENKKDFLPLLLLGDESESKIDSYLERGELFALHDGDLKCICLVTDEGGGTLEIQNLATYEPYQKQGYASKLINHIVEYYKNTAWKNSHAASCQHNRIILGTGDVPGILGFCERRRFAMTHRIPDYFTENYDHPMYEDGVFLKDKVYLERKL